MVDIQVFVLMRCCQAPFASSGWCCPKVGGRPRLRVSTYDDFDLRGLNNILLVLPWSMVICCLLEILKNLSLIQLTFSVWTVFLCQRPQEHALIHDEATNLTACFEDLNKYNYPN